MLPMNDIYRLWDFLLLGFPSLPHFIATAIMLQMRDKLLPLDFNACILFFSNLPQLDIESLISDTKKLVRITPLSLSYEETYSDKYIDIDKWWEAPMPLHLLKDELTPRISLKDLLFLLDKRSSSLSVLDVRPAEEFNKKHLEGSLNVNPKKFNPLLLDKLRGTYVVVVANKGKETKFANRLLQEFSLPYVCILNGGFDVLRYERIL